MKTKEEKRKETEEFLAAVNKELEEIKQREARLRDAISFKTGLADREAVEKLKREQFELYFRKIVLTALLSYPVFKAISNLSEEQKAMLIEKRIRELKEEADKIAKKAEELRNPKIAEEAPEGFADWTESAKEKYISELYKKLDIAKQKNKFEIDRLETKQRELLKGASELEGPDAQKLFFASYLESLGIKVRDFDMDGSTHTIFENIMFLPNGKSLELAKLFFHNPDFTKRVAELYRNLYTSEPKATTVPFFSSEDLVSFIKLGAPGFSYDGSMTNYISMGKAVMKYLGIKEAPNYEGIRDRNNELPYFIGKLEAIKRLKFNGFRRAKEVVSYIIPEFKFDGDFTTGSDKDRGFGTLIEQIESGMEYARDYYRQSGSIPEGDEFSKPLYIDEDGKEIKLSELLKRYADIKKKYDKAKNLPKFFSIRDRGFESADSEMERLARIVKDSYNRVNKIVGGDILLDVFKKQIGTLELGDYGEGIYLRDIQTEEGLAKYERKYTLIYDRMIEGLKKGISSDYERANKTLIEVLEPTERAICEAIGPQIGVEGPDLIPLGRKTLETLYGSYEAMMRPDSHPDINVVGGEVALGQIMSEDSEIGRAVREQVFHGKPAFRYDPESGTLVPIGQEQPTTDAPKVK